MNILIWDFFIFIYFFIFQCCNLLCLLFYYLIFFEINFLIFVLILFLNCNCIIHFLLLCRVGWGKIYFIFFYFYIFFFLFMWIFLFLSYLSFKEIDFSSASNNVFLCLMWSSLYSPFKSFLSLGHIYFTLTIFIFYIKLNLL